MGGYGGVAYGILSHDSLKHNVEFIKWLSFHFYFKYKLKTEFILLSFSLLPLSTCIRYKCTNCIEKY